MLSFVAALALVLTALWFWLKPTDVATLINVDPGVKVVRGGEEIPASNGLVLKENDRIVTPTVGRALFQYLNEETRVNVRHSTELGLHVVHRSKNLQLDSGGIDAEVAEQESNRPMNLVTPQAQALVLGTQFSLIASADLTRLEVRDGAVRIMKSPEGPSVVVERGQAADIQPGQPLTVKPLVPPPGDIRLETWNNLSGVEISEMRPLLEDSVPPDSTLQLDRMHFNRDGSLRSGHRIRGFLHPPRSGAYTFHLSTSGEADLYLGESEVPATADKLMNLRGQGILSDRSRVVLLQSGKAYYFELLVRHNQARQVISLNWTTPDGRTGSILESHVSPFEYPATEPLR